MRAILKYCRWLYDHAKGARGRIALNVFLGMLSVGLNLYFIVLCKRIVDVATKVSEGSIMNLTIVVIAVIILRIVVSAVNTRVENLTLSKMNFIIRKRIYSSLLQMEWIGKEKRHTGDMMNRLETDVATVSSVICTDLPQVVTTTAQLLAALVFLCILEWRLALVLLAITPLFLFLSKIFFKKIRSMTRGIRETESRVQSHLQESLQHRMVIQSLENEDRMESRLNDLQNEEYGQVEERTRLNVFARAMVTASFSFGYIAAFLWGAYGIMDGSLTYGIMTAFLQLVGQIQRPLVNLTRQIPSFVNASASIDRLIELEDAPRAESGEPVVVGPP
ncbi:MAG: ABC transporter ATP-binding protein, partial [Bacteroidales bacterium]|nr:ABC transporter ATP-binding protein [Bacteroidales bacterium]